MKKLRTSDDVIDALGGTVSTAKLTNRDKSMVSNWRTRKRLPPETYLIMTYELLRRGFLVPSPLLWGIAEPSLEEIA